MGTAMWTAVHDATVGNGTPRIIPDSFRELLEHSRDPYSDHHIRCYPPEERAVDVECRRAGSCSSPTAPLTPPARTPRTTSAPALRCTSSAPTTPRTS